MKTTFVQLFSKYSLCIYSTLAYKQLKISLSNFYTELPNISIAILDMREFNMTVSRKLLEGEGEGDYSESSTKRKYILCGYC